MSYSIKQVILEMLFPANLLAGSEETKPNKNKKSMLREHKPLPIRRIQISDFGLPDPKRDPDRHQNCITWSLSHALPLQNISSKSVHKFASNPTDRQTNRQTDRTKNITSFFGGGNYIIKQSINLQTNKKCTIPWEFWELMSPVGGGTGAT